MPLLIIVDDMSTVYALLREAEGIIFATPVYNGGVSAQTKAILDRCRALLAADPNVVKYMIGMTVAVGGDRIGGQELAIQQILTFYILNGVIPVSGGSFGANLGANFWSKDTLEGVKEDKEGFRSLKKSIKKFAEALKEIEIKEFKLYDFPETHFPKHRNEIRGILEELKKEKIS